MKRKNNEKPPVQWGSIMIRVAGVLLCLTLFSFYLTAGLYARYSTRGESGDSARVAAFDVKVNGPEGVTCVVSAMEPGKITLAVDNDSEVAVSYGFRILIDEKAGCGVLVKLDGDPGKRLEFEALQNAEHAYSQVGTLAVGAAAVSHILSFEPLDWTKITSGVIGESKTLTQPFTVYVDVVQID